MLCVQWWEGELERGYVLHRAKCLSELRPISAALATVSIPTYMTPRIRLPPAVQVVSLAGGSGGAVGKGKRKGLEEKEGEKGESGKEVGEEEKDAMVKYVMQDLSRELYTELMEGFHK
jgi:hypothetical protein